MTFATSLKCKPNPELARLRKLEAELEGSVGVASERGVGEESILHHMMELEEDDED